MKEDYLTDSHRTNLTTAPHLHQRSGKTLYQHGRIPPAASAPAATDPPCTRPSDLGPPTAVIIIAIIAAVTAAAARSSCRRGVVSQRGCSCLHSGVTGCNDLLHTGKG